MEQATISIERKPAVADILRSYKIFIDGKKVATIRENEQRTINVQPGEHKIVIKVDWASSPPLDIHVEPGSQVKLICKSNANPLLWFYFATLGCRNYIQLFLA